MVTARRSPRGRGDWIQPGTLDGIPEQKVDRREELRKYERNMDFR